MKRYFSSRLISLAIILVTHTVTCLAQDKLSGSATVSPTGAAIYSVAIETPKGVGDLMPSIGIAYNSQTGNGLVGFGCNVNGLSAITRGTKNIAHDNTVKGISYDNSCALYLDGKRLLLKSGTEGTDGCIYAPEGEPLTNVTLHLSLSNTSCWFEVDTNDGMIYEYGHNGGQQSISNPSAVAAWHITKATNPMGQTITYQYFADGLYLYPQTITYGGDNTVNFTYEARTDSIFFTLRDCRGYVAKRLKTITTKAGSYTYRTYTMSYNTTSDGSETKFSRLMVINETGENGNSSHSLTAQWNYMPELSETREIVNVSLPQGQYGEEYLDSYMLSGDVTGDGIDDIFRISNVKVSIGNEFTFKTYVQVYRSSHQNGNINYDTPIIYKIPGSIKTEFRTRLVRGAVFGDLDGDGINDIVIPIYHEDGIAYMAFKIIFGKDVKNGDTSAIYGTYNFPCESGMPLVELTDLNNDGKVEILHLQKQESNGTYLCLLIYDENGVVYTIPFNFSLSSTPQRIVTSDFNHDGLTDLMVISSSGYRVFYNKGNDLLDYVFENNSTFNTNVTNHERMESGDFNGDGILDFIWNDNYSSQLNFEIGNADGTFTHYQANNLDFNTSPINSNEGTWNCLVTDLDHDGKSDVVINLAKYRYNNTFEKTYTYWFVSNGTSLSLKQTASSNRVDDAKVGHQFAGDFKGNGYFDVANYGYDCYNGTNADTDPTLNIYSCSNHSISNGKVSQFQDSNGRNVSFTYSSMTIDSVYTKGIGSSYPVIDIAAPLCVTSQVREFGGSPMASQTNYTYKGLRAHLQGRGLLGFREVTANETNTGKTITTTTSNDSPNLYIPQTITITTSQADTTSTYVSNISPYVYNNTQNNYKLYVTSKTITDIYGNVTTVANDYNVNYGTLVIEQENKDGGDFHRKTTYVYSPEKIAGARRLVATIQEQEHPDDSESFIKETDYTYDSYGRKVSMTEFSGESLQLVTTYQYDNYGNVIKEKYSGYGISNDTEINYQYSIDGKFLTQKSNIAQTISYTRNAFGDVMAETNNTNPSNPLTTTYTRNGFGTMIREDKPTGEITIWTRVSSSGYGGCYCITDSSNYAPVVKTWYDALGNELRMETTGIGDVEISTSNTYNAQGQLTAKTSVHGSLTMIESYTYDGLGRMKISSSSDGSLVSYAYDDREVSVTKNNQTYIKYYDAWGNVTQSDDPVSSVSYSYKALGKPGEVETENNTVEIEYDVCGNQISLNDLDAGLTTYQYDALHRVISQTDARGNVTTFSYDGAGRITQKTVAGTATTYTYGTTGNGAGRLVGEQTGDRTITYTYDNKGRLSQETRSMVGEQPLTFGYSYNSNGTMATKTYPQGVSIDYVYERNHCIATKMDSTNICLTTLDDGNKTIRYVGGKLMYGDPLSVPVDHGGIIFNSGDTALPMGGDPYTPQDFDNPFPDYPIDTLPEMPFIIDSDHYFAWNSALVHTAEYDTRGYLTKLATQKDSLMFSFQSGTGNLLSRTGMTSQTEAFTYDAIDRLTQVSGSATHSVSYLDNGNIYQKTGPGIYTYGLSNPHAVTNVTNPQNIISSATQTATYTPFGKVSTLSDNGYTLSLTYGPDEQRWKTVLQSSGNTIRTTLYADGYERITENGQSRHFYYLDGGVIYVLNDGASVGSFYYTFTDHLGSITRIYNKNRVKVFSAEYDAWGKQIVTLDTLGFHRGYTGHEMLPEFGLINMNGRLYDPILGRFLSPDNYVQMPDFSQSFNRYSYCLNNPLKYTDPDGEWFLGTLLSAFTDLIDNVVNHGFNVSQYNWDRTVNAWRIDMGMFRGDISQIINKWTWSLPQSIIGNELGQALNFFGKVDNVTYLDGMLALSGVTGEGRAFTIGHYSFGPDSYEATWKDHLFVHEYGHYLQSLDFGPLYIHVIAGPSLISAWGITGLEHKYHWYEVDASRRGARYFDKKYGSGKEGYTYKNPDYFDIGSFENGGPSPYNNPRSNNPNLGKGYPIHGSRFNIFDILSIFLF